MSSLKSTAPLLLAASLALVGCEHPTAPEARARVEKAESQLLSGDYSQMQAGITDLFLAAAQYGVPGNPFVPSAPITVSRDGEMLPMRASVVERVYLPPVGSGGRPLVRRAVMGWTTMDEQHQEQRLLVMFSGDSLSAIRTPRASLIIPGSAAGRYERNGFVLTVDPGDRLPWFGAEGTLTILDGARTGICPYSAPRSGYSSGIVELQDSTKKVECEARAYPVAMTAFIEHGDPEFRDIGSRIAPRRETLRMLPAELPGVRIVFACKGQGPPADPYPCSDYFGFWRDNDQFAPSLGVDLRAMKQGFSGLAQVVDSGSGPDYRIKPGGYDVPVSFTIRSPNGEVLKHVTEVRASDALAAALFYDFPRRQGLKARVIAPSSVLGAGHSPYTMIVADVEFLKFDDR